MKIKVKYSKLGRDGVWGYAHGDDNSIELDTRLKGKKHLEILLHESLHILHPQMTEDEVEIKSIALTGVLWKEGYRRVDNSNTIPMQDGKK